MMQPCIWAIVHCQNRGLGGRGADFHQGNQKLDIGVSSRILHICRRKSAWMYRDLSSDESQIVRAWLRPHFGFALMNAGWFEGFLVMFNHSALVSWQKSAQFAASLRLMRFAAKSINRRQLRLQGKKSSQAKSIFHFTTPTKNTPPGPESGLAGSGPKTISTPGA